MTDGIIRILRDRFDVVGAVTDGQELIEAAARLNPDVIVSDISMPKLSGLESLLGLVDHLALGALFFRRQGA